MPNDAAVFQPVCNRAADAQSAHAFALPADGLIRLVPRGEATSFEGVRQVVDERSLTALLNSARAHGGEMLMDEEHWSHDPEKSTQALAWADMSTAVLRDDGLYAKPRITNTGEKRVLGGDLRFVSPEFPRASLEEISPGLFRPMELVGLAFTNRPGFRNAKPITNRAATTATPPTDQPTMKKDICKLLSLDENTTDDVVLNRLKEIHKKAGEHDTVAAELAVIKNREAAEVDALLVKHAAVIPADDAVKASVRSLLLSNRAAGEKLIEGFASAKGTQTQTPEQKARAEREALHNRAAASTPPGDEGDNTKAEAKASRIRNRAQAIQSGTKGMSWNDAFAAAERELKHAD